MQQTINAVKEHIRNKPEDIRAAEDLLAVIKELKTIDPQSALLLSKEHRIFTAKRAMQPRSDLKLSEKFYQIHKKTLYLDAKEDFDAYLQYLEFDRPPEEKFYIPRRKFLYGLVGDMQKLEDNELDLLAISLPPGTGKTTLALFFMSWIMGKYPMKPSVASAHSDKLTSSFYSGILSILTDPDYLWGDVFPGINIVGQNAKNETLDLLKPQRFTTLTCRSIKGSLNGATRCEKLLYVDDIVSGIEEALSLTRMETLWGKVTDDLRSRRKQGCKEMYINTRWTLHDPIGRLQARYEGNPRAKFVSIPALNEKDESNFEYSFGVGFDSNFFFDVRESMDDVSWRCIYQNEPIEREGLLYETDKLRRYYELPAGVPDAIVGACDTANGGGDDTVLLVAYVYGDQYYIEDCTCDNGLPEITDALCAEVLLRNKVQQCQFESNNAGGRTADKVQSDVKMRGGKAHITKKWNASNKQTRMIVNSPFVKSNFLFKDRSGYEAGSAYSKMIEKLCSYTLMGKNKHDDVPDCMAQLSEMVNKLSNSSTEIFERLF